MTPEQAEDIYMKGRGDAMEQDSHEYRKPVDQKAANLRGFQAVIDAVRKETDTEWCEKLLDSGMTGH